MNKETLAEMINGRSYRNEMHKEEEQIAKESGLIVIFGACDDLVEFRGAIREKIDRDWHEINKMYKYKNLPEWKKI